MVNRTGFTQIPATPFDPTLPRLLIAGKLTGPAFTLS